LQNPVGCLSGSLSLFDLAGQAPLVGPYLILDLAIFLLLSDIPPSIILKKGACLFVKEIKIMEDNKATECKRAEQQGNSQSQIKFNEK
jgi:hypothetical protein